MEWSIQCIGQADQYVSPGAKQPCRGGVRWINTMNRREFLKSTLAATAVAGAAGLPGVAFANEPAPITQPAKANAMILIWLPGGIAQTDTWDPKKHTPYKPGM